MKTKVTVVAVSVLSLLALASGSFAAEPAAANPFAPFAASPAPPAMSVQPHATALIGGSCDGSCTVYCSSGAENFYETTASLCCSYYVTHPCKDGSYPSGAEWFPITCGFAEICSS